MQHGLQMVVSLRIVVITSSVCLLTKIIRQLQHGAFLGQILARCDFFFFFFPFFTR